MYTRLLNNIIVLYSQLMIVCTVVLYENLEQIWVVNLAIPLNLRQAGTVPHTYVDSQSTGLVTTSCDPSRDLPAKGYVVPTTTNTFGATYSVSESKNSTEGWTVNGTESIETATDDWSLQLPYVLACTRN